MPIYNLIEYSDNYSDKSGSLWGFKRDGQNMNNGNSDNVTIADSISFEYKPSFFLKYQLILVLVEYLKR